MSPEKKKVVADVAPSAALPSCIADTNKEFWPLAQGFLDTIKNDGIVGGLNTENPLTLEQGGRLVTSSVIRFCVFALDVS